MNHKSNINMYMKYVQYRFLHYRMATKYELLKMNLVESDKCAFCNNTETIEHLLYNCEKSKAIWHKVESLIRSIGFTNYNLCSKTMVLGEQKKKLKLVDTILSTTKLIIYTNRNNVANLNIRQIIYSLKDLFLIEKYWAETNDKIPWHMAPSPCRTDRPCRLIQLINSFLLVMYIYLYKED